MISCNDSPSPSSSPYSACGRTPPWCLRRQEEAVGTQTASVCLPAGCGRGWRCESSPSTGTPQTEGLHREHSNTRVFYLYVSDFITQFIFWSCPLILQLQTVGQTYCRCLQWTWGWFQTAFYGRAERQVCTAAGSSAGSCSRWHNVADWGWSHPESTHTHTQ